MASDKQIAANRRNGQKGGPNSPRGKAHSRMNALKHGLRAEHVVIPGEDSNEFHALYRELEEHYQPVGWVEEELVKRIAVETWRFNRATLFETGIMHTAQYEARRDWATEEMKQISKSENIFSSVLDSAQESYLSTWDDLGIRDPAELRAYKEAKKARAAAKEELARPLVLFAEVFLRSGDDLAKLSRYQTAIYRRLRQAMHDLEQAQARRKSEAAEAATVIEGTVVDQNEGAQDRRMSETADPAKGINMSANQPQGATKLRKKLPRVRLH